MNQNQTLVDLQKFLRSHPDCAKFIPSLLKDYASWQENRQVKKLKIDPFSQQIYQFLLEQFVVNERDLAEIFRLTQQEIRGKMSYIESQLSHKIVIDRTNPDNWILYLKEEALRNG